ncbi:unnamed protein product [Pleuronectes platessa]|uniref:Uncharacterized protein n=1 Tax=Pleuronectes platessa TaxID=8262 RepID=A0A9N7UVG5_PLEPL|nr:unnamed protein product [Pleuronectes platessa]
MLMGYLMGYLCIISGHRSVVLTSMLKEHVANADIWMDGSRYQVLVDEHKTVKTFGQASLVLNAKEFSWLRQLYDGNCCVKGKSSRNIFHTFLGSSITNPLKFLHLAWTDAGLRGPITFNMIRSSVSTQAERHLSETERRKVALSMCHDPSTAEKFYVSLPTRDVAYENRKLRMKALMHEKRKARAKPKPLEEESSYSLTSESSEEDEEPVYDDRPKTTSLSSEEELMRKTQTRLKKRFFFPSGAKRKLESVGGPEIISPSKIHVTVERLNPIVAQQYQDKWSITVDVPKNETGVASSHQPGTTEGTPSGRAKPRPEEGAPDGAPAAGPAAAGAAAGAAAEPASPPASPPRPGTRSSRRSLLQAGIEAQISSSGGEDESKALDPLSAVFLPWSVNSQVLLETQMSNDVQESQNGAAASPPASPPRPGTRSSRRGLLQAGIEAQISSSGGEDESKALDPLSAVFLPWSGNSQVLWETQMSNDVQESQNGAAAGNNPTSSL